ncbi:hypothetical protein E4V51_30475 [Paenibacillus sp. 28ISP30-2]|nr:hypothetical protein [Paenibacillus sp. 28ISP30-2]
MGGTETRRGFRRVLTRSKRKEEDAIKLGQQVSFQEKKLKQRFPDKPIEAIDMMSYGAMDGKKVLAQAKRMIGE